MMLKIRDEGDLPAYNSMKSDDMADNSKDILDNYRDIKNFASSDPIITGNTDTEVKYEIYENRKESLHIRWCHY